MKAHDGRKVRGAREAGFTLVELLVAMSLMSIVMVLTFTILIGIQRQTLDHQARADSVAEVRLALARIDRQVRSGNVLYTPAGESIPSVSASEQCVPGSADGGSCMRVYTQSNGDQRCVQWQVTQGGILRMRSWETDWEADPANKVSAWQTAARGLSNFKKDPLTGQMVMIKEPFKLEGVSSTYSPRVASITLKANEPGSNRKDVDLSTSLTGRNTVYGYDSGICASTPNG